REGSISTSTACMIYILTYSENTPKEIEAIINIMIGVSILPTAILGFTLLPVESPQKLLMNTLINEYKTNRLEKRIINAPTTSPCAKPPLAISIFPTKPLNGGIPANARMERKKVQPSNG